MPLEREIAFYSAILVPLCHRGVINRSALLDDVLIFIEDAQARFIPHNPLVEYGRTQGAEAIAE